LNSTFRRIKITVKWRLTIISNAPHLPRQILINYILWNTIIFNKESLCTHRKTSMESSETSYCCLSAMMSLATLALRCLLALIVIQANPSRTLEYFRVNCPGNYGLTENLLGSLTCLERLHYQNKPIICHNVKINKKWTDITWRDGLVNELSPHM